MPCSDGGWSEREEQQQRSHEIRDLRKQIDKMEPLLCSACRQLEASGFDFSLNPALFDWWSDHKRKDHARELEEAKELLVKNTILILSRKPINELSKDDIAFLRKHKVL